jgi:hypothetical protein
MLKQIIFGLIRSAPEETTPPDKRGSYKELYLK